MCEPIVLECVNDMISASLILFSSSILDSYIKEALEDIILDYVTEAYKEVINANYIAYKKDFLEIEILRNIDQIVECICKDTISEQITIDLLEEINLFEIAKCCISEERNWNKSILTSVLHYLIDCVVQED